MNHWLSTAAGSLLQLAQADPVSSGGGAAAAAAATTAAKGPGGNVFVEQLFVFGAIFLVFWFLILRPQQKRAKEHKGFLESIKVGTKVVTNSGIFGKITAIDGNTVKIEIAPKVVIKLLKSQVAGVEGEAAEAVANANAR